MSDDIDVVMEVSPTGELVLSVQQHEAHMVQIIPAKFKDIVIRGITASYKLGQQSLEGVDGSHPTA